MNRRKSSYLLEFRLSGLARNYVKTIALNIGRTFGVKGVTRKRIVPHISMVGPFTTNDEKRLVREVVNVSRRYELVTYRFNGYRSFGNWLVGNRVLAVKIEPSQELQSFQSSLVDVLEDFCELSKYDKKWKPHATLAFKDIDAKYNQIKDYLNHSKCPEIQNYVLRITLLKNSKILCEYDFLQRRRFNRYEALDKVKRKITLQILKRKLETQTKKQKSNCS
jgi:2'-5' RNA ligase